PALTAALAHHEEVILVYILSSWSTPHHWSGSPRQEFLCGCLTALAADLASKGGRLIIRQGPAEDALAQLLIETNATAIYTNRSPDPFGHALEIRLAKIASDRHAQFLTYQDAAIHERDAVLTGEHTPFRVFTPYSKAWLKLDKTPPTPTSTRFSPSTHLTPPITPGEAAARQRVEHFLDGPIFQYAATRNQPIGGFNSRLSQDLRHGTISPRELYQKCADLASRFPLHSPSIATFINELIWREFYFQVLWHHPDILDHELQPHYRQLPWHSHWRPESQPAGPAFDRWANGQTGFPIVDAGMRELLSTGSMHNRLRMITAMFLTKDLHIWWMHGESWFMRHLVDGEIASNNGGWQWSSSTGTDAAPYFRIQNPWSQTKRFDPSGAYIKKWVPELRALPPHLFQEPPAPGLPLTKNYPLPMVNHQQARDLTLAMFRR
ncbi:MAG: deoxyribodipyrimidine photo-lyase, partial [Verrucomicrobia bacterium]|nr:deoxyribodipyrimidine photo-lyase [Verrucomicrobiota bacterium]